ncbi:MAG: glycosyltransferase family 1 protein [Cyclobacteriaceae bacterium]|nr:glycosyltransferase family 1 protein [Cyclobacteriaceae bacterium]
MKKTVYINLLNFKSKDLTGAGVFAKSLLKKWISQEYDKVDFVILQSGAISIEEVFELEKKWCSKLIKFDFNNLAFRILFEQLFLPFYLRSAALYFSPTPVLPVLSRIFGRVKLIVTIHDMIPYFIPNKYTRFRSIYVKWISLMGAKFAHKIITVSQNSKKDIVTIANIDNSKIEVVYNFYAPTAIDHVTTVANENLFVCIATVEPGKNVENTLKGFKQFLDTTGLNFKLCWIGGLGWSYTWEELKALVHNLGLESNVRFTGFASEKEKLDLLNACIGTVYLSKYEGFGLPLLESMVHGKPVLTSNLSSLPEVLGSAGVICDPNNLEEISKGFEYLAKYASSFKEPIVEQLNKFTEAGQVDKFLKVINEISIQTSFK